MRIAHNRSIVNRKRIKLRIFLRFFENQSDIYGKSCFFIFHKSVIIRVGYKNSRIRSNCTDSAEIDFWLLYFDYCYNNYS